MRDAPRPAPAVIDLPRRRLLRGAAGLLAALTLAERPALAADVPQRWRIDDGASRLSFRIIVNGIENTGVLPVFEGEGRFDAGRPEETRLELRIPMTELDMGQPMATHFARSPDWFDVARYPQARFTLDRMIPRGGDRWLSEGDLMLRGVRQPVSAPLTLDLGERTARATGEATVQREAFGLGRGISSALLEVGPQVRVRFDLVARIA